ncbi:MAG TPA: ABC transporter ATP-binding protein [Fimbriimonadaceae bacterium]|nr:ABC transporter ATP-binding protein [Fimbriimonadaceae bacterium]
MIEARNASLVYRDHGRDVYACRDVTLDVRENEFLGILGPSGSGKSSLLYLLSGLKIPTSGDVYFNGRSLTDMPEDERSRLRLREFGFVFQQPYLLGYLTALENVLLAVPGQQTGRPRPDQERALPVREDAFALLDGLGLGQKTHRLPHELSGGERQRVCVARALLGHPRVIFADEPTAALDHKNGLHVMSLLNQFRGNGSLVMVTHDQSMLEEADRVVRLADGRIESLVAA